MRELISTKEVAKKLNKTQRQVNRLIQAGKIQRVEGAMTEAGGSLVIWLEEYIDKFGSKEKDTRPRVEVGHQPYKDDWYRWAENGWISKRPLAEATLFKYNRALTVFFIKYSQVNVGTLQLALEQYRTDQYGARHDVYSALTSFAKYLVKNNMENEAILNEFKKYRPERVGEPSRVVCDEGEIEQIFNHINNYPRYSAYSRLLNRLIVNLLLHTGIRVSEAANIKMKDIDLKGGQIFIFRGKGAKDRIVGISNQLQHVLKEYLEKRLDTESPYLLINPQGRHLVKIQIQKRIQKISEQAGVEITAHGLRRTYATLCSKAGMPVEYISKSLGHSNLAVTELYLMTSQKAVVERMKQIELPSG